jgi:hypothetical protein
VLHLDRGGLIRMPDLDQYFDEIDSARIRRASVPSLKQHYNVWC